MKTINLILILSLSIYFTGCSSHKIVNEPLKRKFADDYKFEIAKENLTKSEFKQLKNYVSLCEGDIKKIKKYAVKNKFNKIKKYVDEISAARKKVITLIKLDDYYNEALLFEGMSLQKKFAFEEAKKIYSKVESSSQFYTLAKDKIRRIDEDRDEDGFNDALEIELKTGINNPLSHP